MDFIAPHIVVFVSDWPAEFIINSSVVHLLCYNSFRDAKTWQLAENSCVQDGGHLTTMHSQAEFDDCMEPMIPTSG